MKGLAVIKNGGQSYRSWSAEKKVEFLTKGIAPYQERSNNQEYRIPVYFGDFGSAWEAAEFITKLNHKNPEVMGLPPTHPALVSKDPKAEYQDPLVSGGSLLSYVNFDGTSYTTIGVRATVIGNGVHNRFNACFF